VFPKIPPPLPVGAGTGWMVSTRTNRLRWSLRWDRRIGSPGGKCSYGRTRCGCCGGGTDECTSWLGTKNVSWCRGGYPSTGRACASGGCQILCITRLPKQSCASTPTRFQTVRKQTELTNRYQTRFRSFRHSHRFYLIHTKEHVSWVFDSISEFSDIVNLSSPNTEVGGFVVIVKGWLPNIEPPVPPTITARSAQSRFVSRSMSQLKAPRSANANV